MLLSLLCPDALPKNLFFFDFSIAPALMLYSYIPAIVVSFLIGLFVMFKTKFSLQGKLLFLISISFSLWVLNYVLQWTIAYVNPDFFSWLLTPIPMLLMFFFTAYFVYAFLEKKDIPFRYKIISAILFLPVLLWLSTDNNMSYFDLTKCEGVAGNLWKYIYFLEAIIIITIVIIGIIKFRSVKNDQHFRKVIIFLTIGASSFLAISWLSDVLGEWTNQYQLNFIGPIGMVVFMGLLAYIIVQYKAFNIKLIGANALVVALVILVGSELFFATSATNQILILITLALSLGFGYMLIKSVQLEVQRKEQLQEMSDKLAIANDQLRKLDNAKSEFISIASHQLRTPLTAIKGFVSLMLEGSYGKVPVQQKDVLNKVYQSNERLIDLVEDMLNLSRIESGRMEYKFEKVKMEEVLQEIYDTFILKAKDHNLAFELVPPAQPLLEATTDRNKIREIISNFVDNAIKYTPQGGVKIKASHEGEMIRVAVTDTGIGIPKEEVPYLFAKFSRGKDVGRLNAGGTGLGLHVGKRMIEDLHGKLGVESEGEGKGSTFYVDVPMEIEESIKK